MTDPAQAFGHFDGKMHILPVRIYYEDTDLSGVVYHANYLRYMERARSEFFRAAGISKLASLHEAEPTAWTLSRVEIEYRKPARLDDLIEVRSRLLHLSGARMIVDQAIFCQSRQLTSGQVQACMMTLTGKVRRIPQQIRDKLAPFVYEIET